MGKTKKTHSPDMEVGVRYRGKDAIAIREAVGLSQAEIAALVNKDQSTISRMEQSKDSYISPEYYSLYDSLREHGPEARQVVDLRVKALLLRKESLEKEIRELTQPK